MEMEPVFIRFLASAPILNYFADFYKQVIPHADKKTGKWMLMRTPDIPVTVVIIYLVTVTVVGPCLMRYLKILNVRRILVVYNSFVLFLNLWLGISFTWHILGAGYEFSCQRVALLHNNKQNSVQQKHEDAIASLLWIFHCSKIIELIDTVFLVLKRKENQLTFLHLYHHSTIVVATWIGVKFVPGGSSAVIAMVNSWIHVFMYFYYEMMVLGVRSFRNYKKFVTILQIVQFLATIVHCTTALRRDCGYPRWILTWLLLYMISFLVLFIHFYVQTYWKAPVSTITTSSINPIDSSPYYSIPASIKCHENDLHQQYNIIQPDSSAFSDDDDELLDNCQNHQLQHHHHHHHHHHNYNYENSPNNGGIINSNSGNTKIHATTPGGLFNHDNLDELISSDESSNDDEDEEMSDDSDDDDEDYSDYGSGGLNEDAES